MEKGIGGTLVWYYCMCKRQVWLMAHHILPDETDNNIRIGRLIDQMSYPHRRQRRINIDDTLAIDTILGEGVVAEIKKSSASTEAARLQLAYYLYYLKHNKGIETSGVLMIPDEKRRYPVELSPELERQIESILKHIEELREQEMPVATERKPRCQRCAYNGICWG